MDGYSPSSFLRVYVPRGSDRESAHCSLYLALLLLCACLVCKWISYYLETKDTRQSKTKGFWLCILFVFSSTLFKTPFRWSVKKLID